MVCWRELRGEDRFKGADEREEWGAKKRDRMNEGDAAPKGRGGYDSPFEPLGQFRARAKLGYATEIGC